MKKPIKPTLPALEIGNYDAIRGRSNSQIAAASRSSHKSQGFGSSPSLGNRTEYIELVNGERPASNNPFEGIDTTWSRLDGGAAIGDMVEKAISNFDFQHPEKLLPQLLEVHKAIETLSPSVWKERKLQETKALIKACAGLELQLNAERSFGVAGEEVNLRNLAAVHQSDAKIEIKQVNGNTIDFSLIQNTLNRNLVLKLDENLSSPYWL